MRNLIGAITLLVAALFSPNARGETMPIRFESTRQDHAAIETLLDNYAKAVSSKDKSLFESLLLNMDVPFSDAASAARARGAEGGTQHYNSFEKGVFEGPPFKQRFRDIHIDQDGVLAAVRLVFVNTSAKGTSWGWKVLHLLKIEGNWKIASEFYTGHAG